jgi:WD40 repeat protein
VKCSFNYNSTMIMCGCENGYFYVWNRRSSLPLLSVRNHSGTVNSIQSFWFEGEEYLVSASDDHRVNLYVVNYE